MAKSSATSVFILGVVAAIHVAGVGGLCDKYNTKIG